MWLLLSMAPPVPLSGKVIISLVMVAIATFLMTVNRQGQWRSATTLTAASVAVFLVIALELAFPHYFYPGLDGRGILAAFIGLASGVASARWLMREPPTAN